MLSEHEHSNVIDEDPGEHRFSPVLAENVKRLRTQAKINKKRFALMVGIGRPFLNKIEDGNANPRLSIIVKMADALETTPEYLLTSHREDDVKSKAAADHKAATGRTSDVRHARLY